MGANDEAPFRDASDAIAAREALERQSAAARHAAATIAAEKREREAREQARAEGRPVPAEPGSEINPIYAAGALVGLLCMVAGLHQTCAAPPRAQSGSTARQPARP